MNLHYRSFIIYTDIWKDKSRKSIKKCIEKYYEEIFEPEDINWDDKQTQRKDGLSILPLQPPKNTSHVEAEETEF